jgi:hypothetical protein
MTSLARAYSACAVALIAGAAMFATAASAQQYGTADEAKAEIFANMEFSRPSATC